MKPKQIRWITFAVSIVLYVIALTQPCVCTEEGCGESGEGAAMLLSGLFGFFSSRAGLTWLANPALIFSWGYIKDRPRHSLIASALAFLIACSFLLVDQMMVNEGGGFSKIISYQIGYWLWLSSMFTTLAGNIILSISVHRQQIRLVNKPD